MTRRVDSKKAAVSDKRLAVSKSKLTFNISLKDLKEKVYV